MSWGGTGWGASPPPGDEGPSAPALPVPLRRTGRWWIAAVVLLVAGATAFAVGLSGQQRALPPPVSTAAGPATTRTVRPAARSVPVALTIPAIDLRVPLSELGLNPDHTIQVPTSFQEPGWYEFGPSPGQLGSSVILGHVDSYRGPAVFFQLRTLRPGDYVDVRLADGITARFVVRQVATYLKANFPTLLVYGSHGYSALQLVTCGGQFDSQTGHYLSNVVVYTSLVSTS